MASPFFDMGEATSRPAAAIATAMERAPSRRLVLCVPAIRDAGALGLAASIALLRTLSRYDVGVRVRTLPEAVATELAFQLDQEDGRPTGRHG